MKLNEDELAQVLRCDIGREEYIALLGRKGIL